MLKNKILCLLFPLILLAQLSSSSADYAGFIEKTYSFEESLITFEKVNGYDMINTPDAVPLVKPGYPSLPQIGLKFVIPPNATAKTVKIIVNDEKVIPGEFNILPSQPPIGLSTIGEGVAFVEPSPEAYDSKNPYPEKLASEPHTGTKCGYRIADFCFYPIQYIPAEKKLTLIKNFTVRLHYDYDKIPTKKVTPMQKYTFGKNVKKMVMNPESLEMWAPQVRGEKLQGSGTWEMVIISPNNSSWVNRLQVLADWKTQKGVPCMVKTLQEIYAEYNGVDNPEKIKNFIIDMHENHGTIWVLFGADHGTNASNSIPCRGVYAYFIVGDQGHMTFDMPCERYYEDLADWDRDNDGIWGEGLLDWYADVYVGRMFADNYADANKHVQRILKYEKDPPNYTTKALFYSSRLLRLLNIHWNGLLLTYDCENEIPNNWFVPGQLGWPPGFHYKEWHSNRELDNYEGSNAIVDSMNKGYGFVYDACLGGKDKILAYWGTEPVTDANIYLSKSKIDNRLNPGDKVGIQTGLGCAAGDFADDCIGEHIYDKGAIGGAWNSRESYVDFGSSSTWRMTYTPRVIREFFEHAFNNSTYHLGEAVAEGKDDLKGYVGNGIWNWCLKTYNTFGDPELPMWTGANAPSALTAVHSSEIPNNSSFLVTVTQGGSPVSNACVCCWCENDRSAWDRGFTNGSGQVTLSVNTSSGDDMMRITATKHNYKPYEGTAQVGAPTDLILQNETVEDGEIKTYQASNSITVAGGGTYFTIKNGGDATMTAGNYISLLPGFTAQEGCEFDGLISTLAISSDERKGSIVPLSYDSEEEKPLKVLSEAGISTEKSITETLTLSEKEKEPIPTVLSCAQNNPNPFVRSTTINYGLPKDSDVNLTVFNLAGQAVKTLVNSNQSAGFKSVSWDGRNSAGAQVPQGIYFYVFKAGDFEKHHKMILLK